MKHLVPSLLSLTLIAGTTHATTLQNTSTSGDMPLNLKAESAMLLGNVPARQTSPQREVSVSELRFCGDLYSWTGYGEESEMVQYIYIPAEKATELAGNVITSIFYAPVLNGGKGGKVKGTVFISEDLSKDPVVSVNVNIEDSYSRKGGFYQEGPLPRNKQYEIKADTGFYFGFTMPVAEADIPIALDNKAGGLYAGKIDIYKNGQYTYTCDVADDCGANLVLYARMKGEVSAMQDVFTVGELAFGMYDNPIFGGGLVEDPDICLTNLGSNALTSIDYTYSFNGGPAISASAKINVEPGKVGYCVLPMQGYPDGRSTVTVTVDKINGVSANNATASASVLNIPAGEFYDRKFVVEEGTGLWCGWCPIGIYGMDQMQKAHPDDFIGIAVHRDDAFQVQSYLPMIDKYFGAVPMAVVNRERYFQITPSSSILDTAYDMWRSQVSPAKLDLAITLDESVIKVESKTVFGFKDPASSYRLSYVITEDGLMALQTNYFPTQEEVYDCGDWAEKDEVVYWEFKDTARALNGVWGLDNSLISNVTVGKEYMHSTSFPASCISMGDNGERNFDNAYAIVLLLDSKTGTIVNACRKKLTAGGFENSAVTNIVADTKTEYYTIQGIKVANPVKGNLYIKVENGVAKKVIY